MAVVLKCDSGLANDRFLFIRGTDVGRSCYRVLLRSTLRLNVPGRFSSLSFIHVLPCSVYTGLMWAATSLVQKATTTRGIKRTKGETDT